MLRTLVFVVVQKPSTWIILIEQKISLINEDTNSAICPSNQFIGLSCIL